MSVLTKLLRINPVMFSGVSILNSLLVHMPSTLTFAERVSLAVLILTISGLLILEEFFRTGLEEFA